MISIVVVDKQSHKEQNISAQDVSLNRPAVIEVGIHRQDVQSLARKGDTLILKLVNGEVITIHGFFTESDGLSSDLVLKDDDGAFWRMEISEDGQFVQGYERLDDIEPLLINNDDQAGLLWLLAGAAAAGGIAAVAGHGDGGSHHSGNNDQGGHGKVVGNSAAIANFFDKVGIYQGEFSDGSVTDDSSPVLHGHLAAPLAAGESVRIYEGNVLLGVASVTGTTWSFELPVSSDGTHTYTVVVVAADGREGPASPEFSLTIDTVAPDAEHGVSISIGAIYNDTGLLGDFVTNDNTLVVAGIINGTLSQGDKVQISLDGGVTWSDVIVEGRAWSFDNSANPLPDGTYAIEVRVIDAAGNVGATDSQTLVIDTVAPDAAHGIGISILAVSEDTGIANDFVTSDNSLIIHGTQTGELAAGERAQISLDGGNTWFDLTVQDGIWTYDNSADALDIGSYTIRVRVIDLAGNVGATDSRELVVIAVPAPIVNVIDHGDGTITVDGKAEAGATVHVTFPDGSVAEVVADAQGNYSVDSPAGVVQPEGDVTASATDINGNTSGDTVVAYEDSTAPAMPTVNVTDNGDGTITVDGKAEAGSTVHVTFPDGSTAEVVADAEGNYSVDSPAGVVQPEGDVIASATDINGNTSGDTVVAYEDNTAPAAPIVNVTDNGDGTITVDGKAEAGSTVHVTFPDGSVADVVADAEGNYSVDSPAGVVQPEGDVTASATDINGNTSGDTVVAYEDNTAPAAPIVNVTDNGDGTITVDGKAEAGSTVHVTFPDGSVADVVADAQGNYSVDSPAGVVQPEGDVTASATDINGNTSGDTVVAYEDSTAPAMPTVNVTDNGDGTITVDGKAEAGSTVHVTFPDGSVADVVADAQGNYSVDSPAGVVQPEGDVTASATDINGNTSGDTVVAYEDSTAPAMPTVNVTDNGDGTITVDGKAEAGSTVHVTFPDGSVAEVVADAQGNYSVDSPAGVVQPEGDVSASATDINGNTSGDTVVAYEDSTAPAMPTVNVTDNGDGTITVDGKAEAGATVHVTFPDGSVAEVVADAEGNYSVDSPAGVVQPEGDVVANATDAAGNVSADTIVAYEDSTAPEMPIVNVTDNGDGTITVDGKAEAGATVHVTFPDGSAAEVVADAQGNYSVDSPAGVVQPEGDVTANATDIHGNTSGDTVVAYEDSTAPAAPTVNVTDNGDGTITVDGKAEAGATVHVTFPDGSVAEVVADAQGNYSVDSPAGVVQPDGDVIGSATDINGNTSGDTLVAYEDSMAPAAPTVTVIDNGDGTITVDGKAEAGSTVHVTFPDGSSADVVTDTEGNYSAVSPAGVVQPEGEVIASATDINGNTSGDAIAAYEDSIAPAAPAFTVSDANGNDHINAIGTAEPGAIITVTWPDGSTSIAIADDSGNWSIESPTAQITGEVIATATDINGNTSPSSSVDYVDTTAPSQLVSIDSYLDDVGMHQGTFASGTSTDDATPVLHGTLSAALEAGEQVYIYEGEELLGVATVTDSSWSFELPEVSEGTHAYTARVVDAAGNAGEISSAFELSMDVTAPDQVITLTSISEDTGVSSDDFYTNDNTLVFLGTLDHALAADESLQVSLDGVNWQAVSTVIGTDWSFDHTGTPFADGEYTLSMRVIDMAGNIGQVTEHNFVVSTVGQDLGGLGSTFNLVSDTTHGLYAGDAYSHSSTDSNSDLITRDQTLKVTGSLSAELANGLSLQISTDNGRTWEYLALSNGKDWSYSLEETVETSQSMTWQLRVVDLANNIATNTGFAAEGYKIVVDLDAPTGLSVAPVVPHITSTTNSFTFTSDTYGLVEAGATVSLYSDVNSSGTYEEGLDRVIAFVQADAEGRWSMTTTLPAGSQNLSFLVWDEAGNRSASSPINSVGVTEGQGALVSSTGWGGTTDAEGYGLNAAAVTLNANGQWTFFQSARGTSGSATAFSGRVYTITDPNDAVSGTTSAYLAAGVTTNTGYGNFVNSMTFADVNRDGNMDVVGQVSDYGSGKAALWVNNGNGTYTASSFSQGEYNHLGGVIAYDKEGDGYLDFVLADSAADSISFMKNTNGTITYEKNSGTSNGQPAGIPNSVYLLHEIGAVDINNDGIVDIAAHTSITSASGQTSVGQRTLSIFQNTGTNSASGGAQFDQAAQQNYLGVFRSDGEDDYGNLAISMTWADFNNDGWLDLFLARGATNKTTNSDSNQSRIYLNDGTGKLLTATADTKWFGDTMDGGTSLAVDWNHDGKMDIIEIPRQGSAASPTLYTNNGTGSWMGTSSSLTGSTTYSDITGAVALDYNWDGSMDLVMYRAGADAAVVSGANSNPTLIVRNTNVAADGTSLQIRILDKNGLNVFFSNTVKLYDSAGHLVATQLINPQASGSSNSMGIVSFYGLKADETYSVQLLRVENGVVNHVGPTSSLGGYTNGTVNESWGGLTTGKAHDAYVLTAESDTAVNNTIGGGIVGTGYNDTFFSSAGDDTYNGGAGWNHVVTGQSTWSSTGGMDIVDYSRAPGAVTANLTTGVATGHGNDTLISIEGLIGSQYNDDFTGNAANNVFDGRGGNDTYHLTGGGNDTILFTLLDNADATGGNGSDVVYGFKVGNIKVDPDADVIDLHELLSGPTGFNGNLDFYTDEGGQLRLGAASSGILKFLKTDQVGNDTVLSIDRDGTGNAHEFASVVTLKDVQTDLLTLLANNQILV